MKRGLLSLAIVLAYLACFTVEVPASFVHVKQPYINNVRVESITSDSAVISWFSAVSSDSQVGYGTTTAYGSLTTLDSGLTRSHTQQLNGLAPNTLYHFEVLSRTTAGTLYSAGDFTFSTPPIVIDGMIGGLTVSAIAATSAVISWTTTAPANSIVKFGNSVNYGQFSQLGTEFVTSHSVVLSGLGPQTLYHFRAESADGSGNLGISSDTTFVTGEPDNPASFGGIYVSGVDNSSATVSWATVPPSSSQVDYGTDSRYGQSTPLDPTLTTSHNVNLAGLSPDTQYHYRVRSTDGAGNTLISSDYTFSTQRVTFFYPQVATEPDTYTSVAISNPGSGTAQLKFAAFGATGSELQASDLADPVDRSLAAGSQLALIQDQLFGPGVSRIWPLGWTMVDSSTPRLAGFFMTFNGSLSVLDGAGIPSNLPSSFILPETGDHDYTTLLLSNPHPSEAAITIDLVKTDGTVRSSVQTTIAGWGVYSADAATATFAGLDTDPSDYVRVVSPQGLLPYEFFGNVSGDVAVLEGQDLSVGSRILYSPQYAVGGGYASTLSIVNVDPTPGTVTLELIGDDGSRIGSTKTVPVAAKGKIYVSAAEFFLGSAPTVLTQGYVRVTSDGVRLLGSVTFSDASSGTFTTALPLVAALEKSQVLSHVASNSLFFTGLAILNPGGSDANVTIAVYTDTGQKYETLTRIVEAGHRVSRLLTEYFPILVGQDRSSGYIRVTADQGVACFGLFGTSTLSALSAIPTQPIQ